VKKGAKKLEMAVWGAEMPSVGLSCHDFSCTNGGFCAISRAGSSFFVDFRCSESNRFRGALFRFMGVEVPLWGC
jgi:hypothetical protein